MRILIASSEVYPYSKTGGLADMVGALGKALAQGGHTVGLVTPLYLGIRERFPRLKLLDFPLDFALGVQRVRGEVWTLEPVPGLTVYFIDQPDFYQRPTLYQKDGVDYPDNAERFLFLSKAVAHLGLHLPWQPELVHLNDWQVSFTALFLHHQRQMPGWGTVPRTCLTIHNLAYQGVFPASQYVLTNLPWDYFTPEGVEFYGQVNCLKAGIAYSDLITTVSPRYAREITTEEYGCGLDGLLRRRHGVLVGILNGVDYAEWNTINDPYIPAQFSAKDLSGKQAGKLALQKEFGLPTDPAIPLFGNIGRMVEQKGVDILAGALEEMLSANLQFVQLGTGAPVFQRAFQDLARRYPTRAAVRIGFDEGLSHRIEAGCDFFLMPSRFEPCGLNQMYSLRYGTIPIVRATGGLDDTVIDIKEDAERADGIKFSEYSSRALAKAMRKALALYGEPELFGRFRENAMQADFSWERTAVEFVKVYAKAVAGR
ncbi:MAG TPA: glycogen synthase GlgA [Candidatus Sulfotelmatobacter sp.]|nr:glycogen synthase GlgA [Candidatus Sulfotelmatobacter sp.]